MVYGKCPTHACLTIDGVCLSCTPPPYQQPPKRFIFESQEPIQWKPEDSGKTLVMRQGEPTEIWGVNEDAGLVVSVHSYDEAMLHNDGLDLKDKKIRVIIEVIE